MLLFINRHRRVKQNITAAPFLAGETKTPPTEKYNLPRTNITIYIRGATLIHEKIRALAKYHHTSGL